MSPREKHGIILVFLEAYADAIDPEIPIRDAILMDQRAYEKLENYEEAAMCRDAIKWIDEELNNMA